MTAIYLYHGKTAFTFNYFNYKNGAQAINLAELEMPCGSDIILVGAPYRVFATDSGCEHLFFISK